MNRATVSTDASFPCSDGFTMPGYLARPSDGRTYPAIVFIFEATGLHLEMKRLANEVAAAGYVVLAPDLYARGNAFMCLVRLIKELRAGKGRGVDDLLAARAWLSVQPFVANDRIATMGFCMGGGYALLLSKSGLFKAAADFYGQPPQSLEGACPIVASYGGRDKVLAPKVPALEAELARLAIPHDVKVYPDAGHGFMNEQPNPVFRLLLGKLFDAKFEPADADDAMKRMLAFLEAHV